MSESNVDVPKWQQQQEHAFTLWINERLQPQGLSINNLYDDLDNGIMLIQLLSILFNDEVAKTYNKNCRIKVQKMENCKICFNYLEKVRKLKLVNLGPSDIVDHNQKMVLALIFNIIHHIQIESIKIDGLSGKQGLLLWVKRHVEPLGVQVNDFTECWRDGRAFSALTSCFTSLNFKESENNQPLDRLENSFKTAKSELNVPRLLEPQSFVDGDEIDEHSVLTYISSFFARCANQDQTNKYTDTIKKAVDVSQKHEESIQKYEKGMEDLYKWVNEMILIFQTDIEGKKSTELYTLLEQLQKYRKSEKPEKLGNKVDLEGILNTLQSSQKSNNRHVYEPSTKLCPANINRLFQQMSGLELEYEQNIMKGLKGYISTEVSVRKIERLLDIIEPFYTSQHELYTNKEGLKNVYICMKKLYNVNNYRDVRNVITTQFTEMLTLYTQLSSQNVDLTAVKERINKIRVLKNSVETEKDAYINFLNERINYFKELDDKLQIYLQELYSVSVYIDIYTDEVNEPIIYDDIEKDMNMTALETTMKKIQDVEERMNELKPLYDELSAANYIPSSNPYNYNTLYDSIQSLLNECNNKFQDNKDEMENQKSTDSLQKEFAEAATKAKEYINQSNIYISEGDIYEQKERVNEKIVEFKNVPEVFKDVEEIGKICKQNKIVRNPYTSETLYTLTALREEYVRLLNRINSSLSVCISEREKEGLTQEQQKTVKDVFDYFDKDGSGFITLPSYYQAVKAIGLNMTTVELNEILSQHNIEPNEMARIPMEIIQDIMLSQLHSAINKEGVIDAYQHLCNNKDTISDVTLTKYFEKESCYNYMMKYMTGKGGLYDYKKFVDSIFKF
ncbi:hypothetical protein WA158_000647 [Blastocystis sp. Blastoise]